MGLFLLTFFAIYGGVHFYFYLKVRNAFAPTAAAQAILVVILILGLVAPVIVRVCERYGLEMLARLLSWSGYLWMAFLLLFLSASVLSELGRLLIYLAGLALRTDVSAMMPSARLLLLGPAGVALGMVLYGAVDARFVRSEHLVIRSEKIPKEIGRIRIVQISDVHVGVIIRGRCLDDILLKVREAQPDLLVSTGDLVDSQGNDLSEAAAKFREIRPRYGKFAVTGNHEFYAGIDESLEFTRNAGFVALRGAVANIGAVIDLVGVDDPGIQRLTGSGRFSDRKILDQASSGRFKIFLKHQPIVQEESIGGFDLQLSGHTHKGQIFPFSLITRMVFPYHAGNYRMTGGALLHVSRGTGTWGPPVRFLAPPEITVIDLIPE